MWRFPLRVALVPLLGLIFILLGLVSYSTQAVTAEPLQATNTPAVVSSRQFNNLRVMTHGGCPGTWTVANLQSGSTLLSLVILDNTRFVGTSCAEIRVNDTLQVRGDVALDQPGVVTARVVQRVGSTPTPAATQTISFRGAVIGNPRTVSNGWEVQFNTEVSGAITVTIPSELIPGITPRRGDKADVTAQRQAAGWVATRVQFLSATSDLGFSGLIELLPGVWPYYGPWTIGGRKVVVNANTVVTGIPKLYRRATVVVEMQGNALVAKSISIDPTDAPATAFELAGTALMTDQNPFTVVSRLGCLTFTLDPATSLPPGLPNWNGLTTQPVRVSGSRSLGVTSAFKADTVTVLPTPFPTLTAVEVVGYVDLRQEGAGVPDINLQIGHIVIRVNSLLPNQKEAVQGTVVRVQGACVSPTIDDEVVATAIEVVSRPYVTFSGVIEVIETEGNDITGFQIRPVGSNDRQHILRATTVPFVGGNEPTVGGCLSGYGYYERDGAIRAQRLEVVGCAPSRLDLPEAERGTEPPG